MTEANQESAPRNSASGSASSSCPPPEAVQDLLANRLSPGEAAGLRQHLRDCPLCRERLTTNASNHVRYAFLSPTRNEGEMGWLDTYRILGVLGEGGMAVVFDAEDTILHRPVALKVLRPDLAEPSLRERFAHEARLLASLSHENIVSIYQVGAANGVPYLAMERLAGMTLHEKLQQDHWLPLAEALSLARQAAEGLAVLHRHGLVHRDVKPANIWLEYRNGQFHRIKLIDFGIARRMNESSGLTVTGQVVGTLVYMAPEQAAGKTVDGRADLFSLGCVLYHMLTGQPPLGGRSSQTQTLLREIVRGKTVVVRDKAPQLPGPVAGLIQELLQRKPETRPDSAPILVERLRRLEQDARLDSLPTAPAHAAPEILRTGRRPSSLGVWLGALTLLAAVVVGVVVGWSRMFAPAVHSSGDVLKGKEDPKAENEAIKVGILHSHRGNLADREMPIVHALQLAIEEINAGGGVLGRVIEPVEGDGESDPKTFASEALRLIKEDKVEVLFGCWSSASRKRVAPVCKDQDVLLFYATAYEGLEDSADVVYLGGTPNQTAVPLVRWIYNSLGKRRFYLVGTEDVYSRGMQEILRHHIQKEDLVGESSVPPGESNFRPTVENIKKTNPDVILNTSNGSDLRPFFNAIRAAGIGPPVTPTFWFSLSETELSWFPIESLRGDYGVACYFGSLDRPQSREFLKKYRARWVNRTGQVERVNDDMQTAYFSVYLWKAAVEKAGRTETQAVRRALRGLTVEAPEGPIRIDGLTRHAERQAFIGEITEGSKSAGTPPYFKIVYFSPKPEPPDPFPRWRSRDQWDRFLEDLYKDWGNHWEKRR